MKESGHPYVSFLSHVAPPLCLTTAKAMEVVVHLGLGSA